MARYKKPKVLKRSNRQVKVKKSDKKLDKQRNALPPGKRRAKSGTIYYEYRENRTDIKKDVSALEKLAKKIKKKLKRKKR